MISHSSSTLLSSSNHIVSLVYDEHGFRPCIDHLQPVTCISLISLCARRHGELLTMKSLTQTRDRHVPGGQIHSQLRSIL